MASDVSFRDALGAAIERTSLACDEFGRLRAVNHEAVMQACDKLEAAFGDTLAGLERMAKECAIERVRKQAEYRARCNGVDPTLAAEAAEAFLHEGMSHESAVSLAAGKYRKEYAAQS